MKASNEALQARIDAERSKLRDLRKHEESGEGEVTKDPEIIKSEGILADLVFQQACLRTDYQPDPVQVRGPAAAQPAWILATTYYATNRVRGVGTPQVADYGGDRSPGLEFGRVQVQIPTRRKAGEMNLPLTLWQFELPADPSKHFILKSVTPLTRTAAVAEIKGKLNGLGQRRVLLFVHGFNVTFRSAALRTAQLAHDLDFPGLAMFYSWPSLGEPAGYPRDEEMAQLSIPALQDVLAQLHDLGATDVTVVAHSMGNRVVSGALSQNIHDHKSVSDIHALLLAAPDINADIFREQLAPALAQMTGATRTIYAADSDAALKASEVIHSAKRVGQTAGGVLVFSGFDTVDASRAAPVLRGYGHSYVVDSAPVIGDMQDLILKRWTPDRRGLAKHGAPPTLSWVLP